MKHVVIGTAGHVDHGKTALVYALTEVHTDRLPEEQRRGITIELGFAPWQIREDLLISVIDAPGHRKLVHHMIAGASGIDIVMLVVAGDEGVMPQTREHVAACKLLGVQRAVIVITKLDRADEELAELAAEEARELLEEQGIQATAVLCSAKTGQGIEDVRAAVLTAIDEVKPKHSGDSQRMRLAVDRVFTVRGSGTVVTGTLVEGVLKVGSELRILGPEREAKSSARGLHVHGESREEAVAPTRLAINLGGLSTDEVQRGDVITDDASVRPSRVLDVWLQPEEPLRRGSEGTLFIGTARSSAKIQPIGDVEQLEEGGLARLRVHAPLVVFGGDRFVMRGAKVDGPTGAVIGGGIVLDTAPPRSLRAAKRMPLLQALQREDSAAAIVALAAEHEPRPALRSELPSRFPIAASRLAASAAEQVEAGALCEVDSGWLTATAVEGLCEQALELVAAHHRDAPLEPGLKLQTLRERLTATAGAGAAALALKQLNDGKQLIADSTVVRLPSFKGIEGDPKLAKAVTEAHAALREAALQGTTEAILADSLKVDAKQVRALLVALSRRDDALRAGDLWFDAAAVRALQTQIVGHLKQEGRMTIQQFKDMSGLGRRQSIPLLEHFDQNKVTRRDGSDRVAGSALG